MKQEITHRPCGRAQRLAVHFAMLALASEFLLSGNVLEWFGVPYVEDGGSPAAKLSPGTYLAFVAMCTRLIDGGNPLVTAWRLAMCEKFLGFYLTGIAFCVMYATCLHGPEGVIALLETFLPAGMICVALHDMTRPQAHRAAAILQVLFIVNATLTLTEAISGENLVPAYGIASGARDFRPSALYDHPLTGAAATMLGLRLALPQQPAIRHWAYLLLLLAALISFGGRAALAVTLATSTLLPVRVLARRAFRRRLGIVHIIAPLTLPLVGVALAIAVIATGLADRLAAHLYWDNSAQARVGQFHLLGFMRPDQIAFGCKRADLIALIEPLRLAYGVDVIENFWLLMFATLGALAFPVFLASFAALAMVARQHRRSCHASQSRAGSLHEQFTWAKIHLAGHAGGLRVGEPPHVRGDRPYTQQGSVTRMSAPVLPSIAFFMHDLSGGGVEHMRLRLAAAFASRGHAVTIIVQLARGALRTHVPPDVKLVELGQERTWRSIIPLARVLRAQRPQILFSSLDHNNVAALCARILAGGGTKIVICQHNALRAEMATNWKYRAIPLLYRILAPWSDAMIAVSSGVSDDLAAATGLSRDRMTVIHNPVVLDKDPAPAPAPHAWLADTSIPVFLFVGRLVAQKDPGLLLRAFALRLRDGPARLIFCGDGTLRESLHRDAIRMGIAHCVHFAGYVADPRAWMSHATALIVPSLYEGFGNVIVEALSCGTPVIATDCPYGPFEILAGGRFGWLVAVGDEPALAATMADNARANFPAERLVQRARGFSLFACVARHQALLNRLFDAGHQKIFGLVFSPLSASDICAEMLCAGRPAGMRMLIPHNVDTVRLLRMRPDYARASEAAWLICADGFPVAAYARIRGASARARVTGCEIFHKLATASGTNRRVFVVVEGDATAECLAAWAGQRGLGTTWQAAAAVPALLSDAAGQRRLTQDIAAFDPHILIMALGAPVSEIFLHRHAATLPACWALCCGQAVRVELGLAKRAPPFWQTLNMEWAWRLMLEPRRLGPRYIRGFLSFPVEIWRDLKCSK